MKRREAERVKQIEEKISKKVAYLKARFKDFPVFERDAWKNFEHWANEADLEMLVENLDQASAEFRDYLRRRYRAVSVEKIQKALQSALERGELSPSDFPHEGIDATGLCFCEDQGRIVTFDDKEDGPF